MQILLRLKTAKRLGLFNIARVILYRLGLKTRLHPVVHKKVRIQTGDFFYPSSLSPADLATPAAWRENALYFGWFSVPLQGQPPNWFRNPFTGKEVRDKDRPWWKLNEFNTGAGDIKTVWEPSRFDWVPALAQRTRVGESGELQRLNTWLSDWCEKNPPYLGPNWKCGQEAAVRIIHLALAARFLGVEEESNQQLMSLVKAHLMRISPTTAYAIAQNNNHATSEAAALFMGGDWCCRQGVRKGTYWRWKGRRILENRVRKLFAADGSFSQNSVTYHRLALDTLSVVELWRRWMDMEEFSPLFYERARSAVNWLYNMVDPKTGDAPNLGSNDGANLLPLVDADYRDFRPSVQLASTLFLQQRAYPVKSVGNSPDEQEKYKLILDWFGLGTPEEQLPEPAEKKQFDAGGYTVLRRGKSTVYFRYPRLRWKPGHCDALHVDFWLNGANILRDSGSFSYNAEENQGEVFAGTRGHNTVQFDDREQMPLIGRFRRGAWLEADEVERVQGKDSSLAAAAAYRDWQKAYHHRRIVLTEERLLITDSIKNFAERAVLRWRLAPGDWRLKRTSVHCDNVLLSVKSTMPIVDCRLVSGLESRYYLDKQDVPVLEVAVNQPTTITTHLTWQ